MFALPRENVGVRMRDQFKGLNLLGRGGGGRGWLGRGSKKGGECQLFMQRALR